MKISEGSASSRVDPYLLSRFVRRPVPSELKAVRSHRLVMPTFTLAQRNGTERAGEGRFRKKGRGGIELLYS